MQNMPSELRFTPPDALEALLDATPFLMHISDAEGRLLRMSESWLDRLGYRLDEVVGRNACGFLTPQSAKTAQHMMHRLTREASVNDLELIFLSRTGAPVQVSLNGVGVYADDGTLQRMIAICFDTSRHASYRQEVAARHAAERGHAAKSRLLAQISHEVRTPMNIIMGYMQLARAGDIGAAEAGHLKTALEAAESLMTQMADMLDLFKAEAGRLNINFAPMDLAAQLRKLADQAHARLAARGLELKLELDPALPTVARGDCARILQVLHNFMSNAIKFTEKGSIILRAHCVGRSAAGWRVRIEVEDTGRGIPAAAQEHLFNSFSRADDVTAFEGWGLGLSICRSICKLMDADLGMRSVEGRGACFHIELNLAGEGAAPPHPPCDGVPTGPPAARASGRRQPARPRPAAPGVDPDGA